MPFFLSLDHSYRLINHLKFFPRRSQVGCGTLEWASHILAQTVCTRCLCTQTKPTNQTKPEFHQPGVTLQMKQKAKRCPEIKAKWQECSKMMVTRYPEIKSQMSLWTKKDVQHESCKLSFIWGKMRTAAQEAVSHIPLRDCSRVAVGEGQ